MPTEPLVIAGRAFQSRLLLGTGKFSSNEAMAAGARGRELVVRELAPEVNSARREAAYREAIADAPGRSRRG